MSAPSFLVISYRGLERAPWYCHPVEVEDVLCDMLQADRIDFVAQENRIADAVRHRGRVRAVVSKVPSMAPYALPLPERHYDVAIVVVNNLDQIGLLELIDGWRGCADVMVAIVSECWPAWLDANRRIIREQLSQFDRAWFLVSCLVDDIAKESGIDVSYLPCGIDTLAVTAPRPSAERRFEVTSRGRRDAAQHEALRAFARSSGGFYDFDTNAAGRVASHAEHRHHYMDICSRSRAFVCNYARFDQPEVCGPAREFGLRYFEALAAGTVPIGQHPPEELRGEILGEGVHLLDLPLGAQEIDDALARQLTDHETLTRMGLDNRRIALQRHDVVHRWTTIAAALGLPPTPGVERRLEALDSAIAGIRA